MKKLLSLVFSLSLLAGFCHAAIVPFELDSEVQKSLFEKFDFLLDEDAEKNEETAYYLFREALKSGAHVALKSLFDAKTSECIGQTLRWAAFYGCTKIVEFLSTHEKLTSEWVNKAFRNAARYGYLDIVTFLAKHPKLTFQGVNWALHWTIFSKDPEDYYHKDVFNFLLKHEKLTVKGVVFALDMAQGFGHFDLARVLKRHENRMKRAVQMKTQASKQPKSAKLVGFNLNKDIQKSLFEKFDFLLDKQTKRNEEAVCTIFEKALKKCGGRKDLSNVFRTRNSTCIDETFRWAAFKGHKTIIKFLSFHKKLTSQGVDWAFRQAACRGYFDIVEFLTMHPKLTNQGVDLALQGTIYSKDPKSFCHKNIFNFILKHEKLTVDGVVSMLKLANDCNHTELVRQLKKHEKRIKKANAQASKKSETVAKENDILNSLFQKAIAGNSRGVVVALGKNKTLTSEVVNKALRWAAVKGYVDVIRMYVQHKNVSMLGVHRAIRSAARYGYLKIVKCLASHSMMTPEGVDTALVWTIIRKTRGRDLGYQKEVFDFLLTHEKLTSSGINQAIATAYKFGHHGLVTKLKRHEKYKPVRKKYRSRRERNRK